ncbi:hypothetical protein PVAP13_8KG248601 [Panicum virgatum]|uniref:Uncharacterized protein n=1 Tax=Panicum virgatum TaxID=38727 RepID=A0A8T0PJM5_PANVG|nr:hypothetical protein PVAP13_8KG248601 [Panicum virgatum]
MKRKMQIRPEKMQTSTPERPFLHRQPRQQANSRRS